MAGSLCIVGYIGENACAYKGDVFIGRELARKLSEEGELFAVYHHEHFHIIKHHRAKMIAFGLLCLIVTPLWFLIPALSRRFEFEADRYAAERVGADAIVSALGKIGQRKPRWTHPSTEQRILKIKEAQGGKA